MGTMLSTVSVVVLVGEMPRMLPAAVLLALPQNQSLCGVEVSGLLAEIPRTLGDVVQEHRLRSEALTLYDRKGIVTWRREAIERLARLRVGPTP